MRGARHLIGRWALVDTESEPYSPLRYVNLRACSDMGVTEFRGEHRLLVRPPGGRSAILAHGASASLADAEKNLVELLELVALAG